MCKQLGAMMVTKQLIQRNGQVAMELSPGTTGNIDYSSIIRASKDQASPLPLHPPTASILVNSSPLTATIHSQHI